MNAGRDLLFFILFLIALGVVWFLTGGPARSISHSGWFLVPGQGIDIPLFSASSTSLEPGGTNSQGSLQTSPPNRGQTQGVWNYFYNSREGLGTSLTPETSPYAPYVRLEKGNAQASDLNQEYVVIETSSNLQNPITISGWVLENATTGMRATIGNAVPLLILGKVNSPLPMSIGPQSVVVVATSHPPNGESFRVNECTGYLSQFQNYNPGLANDCPNPLNELLRYSSTANSQECYNYVSGLPNCRIVVNAGPIYTQAGAACQDFVANILTYDGCVTNHKDDPHFYANEWRVFLNRNDNLWGTNHALMNLLDENNKLVSQVSY